MSLTAPAKCNKYTPWIDGLPAGCRPTCMHIYVSLTLEFCTATKKALSAFYMQLAFCYATTQQSFYKLQKKVSRLEYAYGYYV